MDLLKYQPLGHPGKVIRLLHVFKGDGYGDINCELIETPLAEGVGCPYVALSYTWGGHQRQPQHPLVLIDGRAVHITDNLHEALRHIRSADHDVFIWVDAYCINQNDTHEKSQQVAMMADIFRSAEEVIVWLGSATNHVARLFEAINKIDEKASSSFAAHEEGSWADLCKPHVEDLPDDPLHSDALEVLLHRRWFTRIWILQEIAFARIASIRCGPYVCSARTFAAMPRLMQLAVRPSTQAILDIMPRARKNTWWSSQRDLHSLLCKFTENQATRHVDRVYALLGISTDACLQEKFYPDYSKAAPEVFSNAASFLVFGRVLGLHYEMPVLSREDLNQPIIMIAYKILCLELHDHRGVAKERAYKTVRALIEQLNQADQRTKDLLPLLLAWSPRKGAFLRLPTLATFRLQGTPVKITYSFQCAGEHIEMALPEIVPDQHFLSPPFRDFGDIDEAIEHFQRTGASREELLRAYVWKGDLKGVQAQLDLGASTMHKDEAGHSAMTLADQAQDLDILKALRSWNQALLWGPWNLASTRHGLSTAGLIRP